MKSCGTGCSDENLFCDNCGTKFSEAVSNAEPAPSHAVKKKRPA